MAGTDLKWQPRSFRLTGDWFRGRKLQYFTADLDLGIQVLN